MDQSERATFKTNMIQLIKAFAIETYILPDLHLQTLLKSPHIDSFSYINPDLTNCCVNGKLQSLVVVPLSL
jgi:hypothetical protein